jgi:hypothetical protein
LINKQEQRILNLFQPKKINYDFNQMGDVNRSGSKSPEKRKPVIDYKVKIKQLEKEIHTTRQKYNDTKTKNKILRKDLDEMRKNVNINKEKFNALHDEFVNTESSYWEEKKKVENNISSKQEFNELQSKIFERKKLLEKQNKEMIKKIKETDRDMTLKFAEKKFYDHEKLKLIEKENRMIAKWNKEREKFLNKNKEDIAKMNAFTGKSKVLELLLGDQIDYFEKIIQKLSKETNIDEICKLVEYFINSTKEVKYNNL